MSNYSKIGLRAILLFGLAIIITSWYFNSVGGNLVLNFELENIIGRDNVDMSDQINTQFNEKIDEINSLLKIPSFLMNYGIYAENKVMGSFDGIPTSTLLRVDIDKKYEKIPTNSKHEFVGINLKNPEELKYKKITISVSLQDESMYEYQYHGDEDSFYIGIFPTTTSWLVIFFTSIFISYGFIFSTMKFYRFIVYSII